MKLSDDGTTLLKVDNSDITDGVITLPEGVTAIGDRAFWYCSGLTQLILPKGVKTIGDYAFYDCSSLTQLTLPEGVMTIGASAFSGCTGLTQFTLPEGVKTMGHCVFSDCSSLMQLTLPKGVTTIGGNVFLRCTGLQQIVVNTNNDVTLGRIKNLLPQEYRNKVIKNPIYDEVIEFQKDAYQVMPHKLSLSCLNRYFGFFEWKRKLSSDVFSVIAGFEGKVHQAVKMKVKGLVFPTTPEALQEYKKDYNQLLSEKISQEVYVCIAKLQSYVNRTQSDMEKKHPGFWGENTQLLEAVNKRLGVTRKAIKWLEGESDLSFTPEEVDAIDETFVAKTLKKFSITLPTEEPPQETPNP